MSDIILSSDLPAEEYLRSELVRACSDMRVAVSEDAIVYVAGLLGSIIRWDAESPDGAPSGKEAVERYLAPDLCRSEGLGRTERMVLLQGVGDSALLLSGYWWQLLDHGRKRGGDSDYHRTVGMIAYRTVSLEHPRASRAALFAELSGQFHALTGALAKVSARIQVRDSKVLVGIYARYLETHSRRLELILLAHGFDLSNEGGTV